MTQSDTVYLLDASIYIFRAWFGYPDRFFDAENRPVNAVYGYLRTLLTSITRLQPGYMVAAFDVSLFSGIRHQIYPGYKANRALPDPSLAYQLDLCRLLTQAAGISCLADQHYEADDLIDWAAVTARQQGRKVVVISRDKDLAQVVAPGDELWDWSDDRMLDYQQLIAHWGLKPDQIADFLALAGDASDNIPGIAGIGKKTALALLQAFGSLEGLYGNLAAVETLPVRGARSLAGKLEFSRDQAMMYRELTRLHHPDSALPPEELVVQKADPVVMLALVKQLGLGAAFEKGVLQWMQS